MAFSRSARRSASWSAGKRVRIARLWLAGLSPPNSSYLRPERGVGVADVAACTNPLAFPPARRFLLGDLATLLAVRFGRPLGRFVGLAPVSVASFVDVDTSMGLSACAGAAEGVGKAGADGVFGGLNSSSSVYRIIAGDGSAVTRSNVGAGAFGTAEMVEYGSGAGRARARRFFFLPKSLPIKLSIGPLLKSLEEFDQRRIQRNSGGARFELHGIFSDRRLSLARAD
jgi:hypothetical protein